MQSQRSSPNLALAMATLAFAVAFAGWSLLSPLATRIQQNLGLSELQISFLIAVPVILGSLLRIPFGILTDRYGGRLMFTLLLVCMVPVLLLTSVSASYPLLLFDALLLGLGGASFAIGVPFVSRHFPPERQGFALGVYGAGNIGTALAARAAPQIAEAYGLPTVFITFAALTLAMAVAFWLFARDVPRPANAPAPGFSQSLAVVRTERRAWLLSLFYFLTFGGFVAFSLYLPKMLVDLYAITPIDAGNRVFVFVLLATLGRPLGGWLADRLGGNQVLRAVFAVVAAMAVVLTFTTALIPLTIACLSSSLMLGIGNGAVFKLVPQWFPGRTGVVTGIVGAACARGGFFPPLVLRAGRQSLGGYSLGVAL
ncbi:MAG TPA: MFS transporter, partial [Chloroflexaceae bacterium]|nr:MFS transporter [Chloroflexaceae bacterium]